MSAMSRQQSQERKIKWVFEGKSWSFGCEDSGDGKGYFLPLDFSGKNIK